MKKSRLIILGQKALLESMTQRFDDKIFTINETFQKRVIKYCNDNNVQITNKDSFSWAWELNH